MARNESRARERERRALLELTVAWGPKARLTRFLRKGANMERDIDWGVTIDAWAAVKGIYRQRWTSPETKAAIVAARAALRELVDAMAQELRDRGRWEK